MCCAFVEKRHVCLQLLLSKALSCHVQNFTIVSDIQEIYSTWSSFVSVVNHCLFGRFVAVEFVVMRSFVVAEAGFMGSGDWGNL